MANKPAKKTAGTKLINHALDDDYGLPIWKPVNEFEEFFALAFNAFKVENANFRRARIIKRELLLNNYVGYDAIAGDWYRATPIIQDNELYPRRAQFHYPYGRIVTRELSYKPGGNFYLFQGLAANITYAQIIHNHTDLMYDCDIAIRQNLNATRAPSIIPVEDEDTRLSIKTGIQQQQAGLPVVVVSSELANALKAVSLNTPITFPTIYEFRQKIRDSLLNKLSTLTANTEKRERVQSAEVNAGVSECEDYIYSFLDNVNEQFKSYGFDERLVNNTSLEEMYSDDLNNDE